MKKVILAALVAVVSLTANAQLYVGGSLSFDADKANSNADTKSTFVIKPEVGYSFNEKWAAGIQIGYKSVSQSGNTASEFTFAPYARYTYAKSGIASFFVDGGVSFDLYNNDRGTVVGIGVRPGVKLSASEKVDFVASLGYLGYKFGSDKHGKDSHFGIGVDNTAVSFGVYYSF